MRTVTRCTADASRARASRSTRSTSAWASEYSCISSASRRYPGAIWAPGQQILRAKIGKDGSPEEEQCHGEQLTHQASLRLVPFGELVLTGPLDIGQVPPAAEGLVELDIGGQPIAADLRERRLRRIELLLGLEHLVVAGQALAVSI